MAVPGRLEAVTYMEIFDVPPPSALKVKKNANSGSLSQIFGVKGTESKPQSAMTLSERFATTQEGSRRLKQTSDKFENETNRIRLYKCPVILDRARPDNTEVIIEIREQRAYLMVDGMMAMETPISSARTGKETPRGTFRMTERVRDGKISNLYDVEMPYWMRLNDTVFGVHAGYLPGYPASAGCIRLPKLAAQIIYENTQRGTRVHIHNDWSPSPSSGGTPPYAPSQRGKVPPAATPLHPVTGQPVRYIRI